MSDDIPVFWPDFNGKKPDVTPKAILTRQAEAITDATGGRLHGVVHTKVLGRDFCHTLQLETTGLDDYSHFVVRVRHAIETMYPLRIFLMDNDKGIDCPNEADFCKQLQDHLAQERTTKTVQALLAQSG